MEEEKGEERFSTPPVEGSTSSPPGEGNTVATGPPVERQMTSLRLGDSSSPSSVVVNLASDFAATSSAVSMSAAAAPSPAAPSPAAPSQASLDLSTTLQKMQLTLDAALDSAKVKVGILDAGAIEMMRALVSLSHGVVSTSSTGVSSPQQQQPTCAAVAAQSKTVVLTAADVKRLPRLSGSPHVGQDSDVDVVPVLEQYRTVAGFKAESVRPDDDSCGDVVAFEFFRLICDGAAATMLRQLMNGCIDWQADAITTAEMSTSPGSYPPPSTWDQVKNAVLDFLMPSNSVEDCALKFDALHIEHNETVSNYAARFRTLKIRYESSVERATLGRSPWEGHALLTWLRGFPADIQDIQKAEKPVTSLRDAVERARRHEATVLAGPASVSAMSFTRVAHNLSGSPQFPAGSGRAIKRPAYSRPCSGGASSSGGSSGSRRPSSSSQGS